MLESALRGRVANYDDASHAHGLFGDKDKLRVSYGDHFLAELILNQNQDEQGEFQDQAGDCIVTMPCWPLPTQTAGVDIHRSYNDTKMTLY